MLMNYRELSQMYRTLGPQRTCQTITESLQRSRAGEIGHLRPADFSIRQLAESLVENGVEWVRSMDPARGTSVMESSDAVDSTAFSNITGQLIINELMDSYENPAFSISDMFRTVSTRLNGEVVPGIGKLGDKTEVVHEGMPYPHVGVGEDFVETPKTTKRGLIVPVTKETIFFDRTGLILERAREVGESLRINKEKRCVDVLIGAVNNHKWKGTTYNTYLASGAWANTLSGVGNALVDWTNLEAAELMFAELKDPNTGEPIAIMPNTLIATPFLKHTINRMINATEVRHASGNITTLSSNPVAGAGYRGITSQYIYSRLQSELGLTAAQAKATYFFGDPDKAFRYMENWPITVVQAPQNSEAEFNQDIVARFKASERGVPFAKNPRYMLKVSGHN